MNWKETVIHNKGCKAEGYITGGIYGDKKVYYDCTCGREHQAELSFKAGMAYGNEKAYEIGLAEGKVEGIAEGIKEVVEFVATKRVAGFTLIEGVGKGICIPDNIWKAKLKEWGL